MHWTDLQELQNPWLPSAQEQRHCKHHSRDQVKETLIREVGLSRIYSYRYSIKVQFLHIGMEHWEHLHASSLNKVTCTAVGKRCSVITKYQVGGGEAQGS